MGYVREPQKVHSLLKGVKQCIIFCRSMNGVELLVRKRTQSDRHVMILWNRHTLTGREVPSKFGVSDGAQRKCAVNNIKYKPADTV